MPQPHTHLFEVEAAFPACGDEVSVVFPVWTPGSYLVREYARHVQDLKVFDAAGAPLPFRRTDKRGVVVQAGGEPFRLTYRVYANELTVRTSHLDSSHGYFNGATLFFYVEALRHHPHHVAVDAPAGWRVTVALEQRGAHFVAPDYDELVDAPFEIGPHRPITFQAERTPHEIVLWGEPQLDEKKLVADLTRIVETQAALFGGLPTSRYVFFLYATDKGRGGLEHKHSTALLFPRTGFQSPKGWEDFLSLACHEYFHLWNVKRIKPKALVPFDYASENYTQLLWWFEGGTSYYDTLLLRRAGLLSAPRYVLKLGETITTLQTTPGRGVLSLVDASFLSWVKHYRPDENAPNSMVSYYLKGEIVCALLDLTIRKLTKDAKSLDDVLRLLWRRYGDESGVPEAGVEEACAEIAGQPLTAFFDASLRGLGELDYSVFTHVGLELKLRQRESPQDKGGTAPRTKIDKPQGYLGVLTKGAAGIASVLDGSPAAQAGVYADDELVALDGFKVDASSLLGRCEDRRPGDVVRLTVFRRDRLVELEVTLGSKPLDAAYLAKVPHPNDAQRAAYKAWLGAPFDDDKPQPTQA